jgi:hypothetical protein
MVALTANALNLTNITSSACSLDIFKVHQRILAQVDDGTKVVVQSYYKL